MTGPLSVAGQCVRYKALDNSNQFVFSKVVVEKSSLPCIKKQKIKKEINGLEGVFTPRYRASLPRPPGYN